jgi:hypothetical protein
MNNLTYDAQSVEIQYLTIPKTWYFEIYIEGVETQYEVMWEEQKHFNICTTHRFKCMNNLTYDVQSVEIQYLTIPKTWYFEIYIELPEERFRCS